MATSILNSVGSAVAGPVGAVVGSLLGRQIDRQLFRRASAARISDLRVPSANYGAEVPAIAGAMRVAGTVVWASDVVEGIRASKNGSRQARSVSFALALSSSELRAVKRIWADGRLIRGAAGDHKTAFQLRLLSGTADQQPDPLISSFEGTGSTPAYRNMSLLIFEDFDLGSFGNRIPQINVEIESTTSAVSVATLIASTLKLPMEAGAAKALARGFALQGETVSEALLPLISLFRHEFSFGASWEAEAKPLSHHLPTAIYNFVHDERQVGSPNLKGPAKVAVRYFDEGLDFGVGEKSVGVQGTGPVTRFDFPGTLTSDQAKALAQEQLAAIGSEKQRITLSLPLANGAGIRLGDRITTEDLSRPALRVVQKRFRNDHVELVLLPATDAVESLQSDAGRIAVERDEPPSPLRLAAFELPGELNDGRTSLAVAVAGGKKPYRPVLLDVSIAGATAQVASAERPAITGRLMQPVGGKAADILDLASVIDVELDSDDWLFSVDDADLYGGANIAFVGSEVLQFGSAVATGDRRYRLRRLIRGRFGSNIVSEHAIGTGFVLFEPAALSQLPANAQIIGAPVQVRTLDASGEDVIAATSFQGAFLLPLSPVHLAARWMGASLQLSWIRRSRQGAPWLDHVDAPLGESSEGYLVAISGVSGVQLELTSSTSQIIIAPEVLNGLGAKPWTCAVRQVGDFGVSRERLLEIN